LTRLNFPHAEVFHPLVILLAQRFTQADEAQSTATDEAEGDDAVDDGPRPEVAGAILVASNTTLGREPSGQDSADDGEQGGEIDSARDGTIVRNFRSTAHTLVLGDIPIYSIWVKFPAGDVRVTTERMVDIAFSVKGPATPGRTRPATR